MFPMIFAGMPPTIIFFGILLFTTALGAITTLSSIISGPCNIAPGPIQTLFPILGTFLYGPWDYPQL